MSDKKSKWALWGIGLACVACCAVPLYLVMGGVAAVGISASVISPAIREILICVLPIMSIGLVIFLMSRKKKSCCDAPQSSCNSQQCQVKDHA